VIRKLLSERVWNTILLILTIGLAVCIPLTKTGVTVGTIALGVITLLITPLSRWKTVFLQKKSFLALFLLFAWSFLSLAWSHNSADGFRFINLVLPFFILFFVFSLRPFAEEKHLKWILNAFLISVTYAAFHNLRRYYQAPEGTFTDMRELSVFVSHIRFALMITISIVICGWKFKNSVTFFRWFYLLLIVFLLYYTFISEVITGYLSLFFIVLMVAGRWIFDRFQRKRNFYFLCGFVVLLFAGMLFGWSKYVEHKRHYTLLTKTAQGNYYWSDTTQLFFENGNITNINIQFQELKKAWAKRSSISLDTPAQNGQKYLWNLIRYMTSKGLTKDAEGVQQLTDSDVEAIENGKFTTLDVTQGPKFRLLQMRDELLSTGIDPNGYTMKQREEYWSAGWHLFLQHFWKGTGSGDLMPDFRQYYAQTHSRLTLENQRKTHLQFLTFGIRWGVVGLGLFVIFLVSIFKEIPRKSYYFVAIIIGILIFSFLNEDTIETLTGGVLCAFFMGLFSGFGFQRLDQENRLDEQDERE